MQKILDVISIIGVLVLFFTPLLSMYIYINNRNMPKWVCDRLGWHIAPKNVDYNGKNLVGKCPRCGKPITMSELGEWR